MSEQIMKWHPWPEEVPDDEDLDYILCISGKLRGTTYVRAVVMNDNYFEDGRWFIRGVGNDDIIVHAWMEPPEPYCEDLH